MQENYVTAERANAHEVASTLGGSAYATSLEARIVRRAFLAGFMGATLAAGLIASLILPVHAQAHQEHGIIEAPLIVRNKQGMPILELTEGIDGPRLTLRDPARGGAVLLRTLPLSGGRVDLQGPDNRTRASFATTVTGSSIDLMGLSQRTATLLTASEEPGGSRDLCGLTVKTQRKHAIQLLASDCGRVFQIADPSEKVIHRVSSGEPVTNLLGGPLPYPSLKQ